MFIPRPTTAAYGQKPPALNQQPGNKGSASKPAAQGWATTPQTIQANTNLTFGAGDNRYGGALTAGTGSGAFSSGQSVTRGPQMSTATGWMQPTATGWMNPTATSQQPAQPPIQQQVTGANRLNPGTGYDSRVNPGMANSGMPVPGIYSPGGMSAGPQPSPNQNAMSYLSGGGFTSTQNPVAPGSGHNGGIGGPSQVASNNAWQNMMNLMQTQQAFGGGRGGQMATNDYGMAPASAYGPTADYGSAFGNAMQYLGGGGFTSTQFPVAPGSVHNGGIGGPSQAAALGAWQNQNNIAQTMQAFGYRGNQMATSDYGYDPADGQWKLTSTFLPAPAGPGTAPGGGGAGGNPGGGAGGGGGQPSGPGISDVTSSIDPSGVYNSGQSQKAINQYAAQRFTEANPDYLMKRFSRPGLSRDAGTLSRVMPQVGQAQGDVAFMQQAQPLMDQLANQQQLLQGQLGQGQEAIGLANLLASLQRTYDYADVAPIQALTPLLSSLFSSFG